MKNEDASNFFDGGPGRTPGECGETKIDRPDHFSCPDLLGACDFIFEEAIVNEPDPVIEECIRDALGPYMELLSDEEIAEHRRLLIAFIKTHPVAVPLYDRLRKRGAAVDHSGEVAREDATAELGERSTGTSGAGQ